jgi:quercetin dioxygenase-like cupin family protein
VYALIRGEQIELAPAYPDHSGGFRQAALIGGHNGSVHMGLALAELTDGHLERHVHSFEEAFYVLSGEPVLELAGRCVQLVPGACGAIPVGVPHAWRSAAPAQWIFMAAPRPRGAGEPPDTFFLGGVADDEASPLDVRDPRNLNLFLYTAGEMDLDRLKEGAAVGAPTVSASMATAALAYSGITVKMLVDQRLDAQLLTMFMVGYAPGGVAHLHDHPFEESYFMLEGEIEVVADGDRHTLRPGDVFWTGAGTIHAFYETRGERVLWLETSAPQPPNRHSYRFERDWDYLKGALRSRVDE